MAQSYSFDSLIAQFDEAALQAAPAKYPAWVSERYLQLPESVPERVRALARDLTAHARTPFESALAIEAYLREFPYRLKVPAPPGNWGAVDYFLFDLKKGYCDYYATAMAVLARSAGLPSRLVTGYASGSYDPYSAQYVVTQADAHAWTEIYFAGIGWVEFEPTANQPATFGGQSDVQRATVHPETPANGTGNLVRGFLRANLRAAWWLLSGLGARYVSWLAFDFRRLKRMNPNEAMQRVYLQLRRWTRRANGIPPSGQTARESARALAASMDALRNRNRAVSWFVSPLSNDITALTDLYMQSLFAPEALSPEDGRRAIRFWLDVLWRLGLLNIVLALSHAEVRHPNVPSKAPEHPTKRIRTGDRGRAHPAWQA